MNEIPFNNDELTAEDLAVLQAFEAMENWDVEASPHLPPSATSDNLDTALDDMFIIFAKEAEENVTNMQRALSQLEQDGSINLTSVTALRRASHKMRGTAGSLEYFSMEKISAYIETMAEQIAEGFLLPEIGLNTFPPAVHALEATLKALITSGEESNEFLAQLEIQFQELHIDSAQLLLSPEELAAAEETSKTVRQPDEPTEQSLSISQPLQHDLPIALPTIGIDLRRVESLLLHTRHLEELRTPLEGAQAQVESALYELYTAQSRLQQFGPSISSLFTPAKQSAQFDEHSTSSLIARILDEALQKNDTHYSRKTRSSRARTARTTPTPQWDDLEVERFSEQDILIRSLNEIIMDVTMASSRVRVAFMNLKLAQREYVAQASIIRNDALLLRLVPLATRIPLLQQEITKYAATLGLQVQLEVKGEMTEVDQDILDTLTGPLLQLIHICLRDTFSTHRKARKNQSPHHIWLYAQELGNEIAIEIGFSFTIHVGNLTMIRESIQRLHGTLSLQRNETGVSFHLRLSRSRGTVHCLQVRLGQQHLLVPFSQIQRIGEGEREKMDIFYRLSQLLNLPGDPPPFTGIRPLLILLQGISHTVVGVAIDEVVGDVELVIKPLATHLQRPGITGAAIDGKGKVLLMVDLPELVRHYSTLEHSKTGEEGCPQAQRLRQPKILIADDSVFLRQLLLQTLQDTNYIVTEARDGLEALEQLLESTPDVFFLDVEMPNLNGYDLLNIMRLYPELASVKIVMLTARTSEKHRQRARELGAHAFLTKPCSPEAVKETIQKLLTH